MSDVFSVDFPLGYRLQALDDMSALPPSRVHHLFQTTTGGLRTPREIMSAVSRSRLFDMERTVPFCVGFLGGSGCALCLVVYPGGRVAFFDARLDLQTLRIRDTATQLLPTMPTPGPAEYTSLLFYVAEKWFARQTGI